MAIAGIVLLVLGGLAILIGSTVAKEYKTEIVVPGAIALTLGVVSLALAIYFAVSSRKELVGSAVDVSEAAPLLAQEFGLTPEQAQTFAQTPEQLAKLRSWQQQQQERRGGWAVPTEQFLQRWTDWQQQQGERRGGEQWTPTQQQALQQAMSGAGQFIGNRLAAQQQPQGR